MGRGQLQTPFFRAEQLLADQPIIANSAAIRRDLQYMTARWGELNAPAMFEVRAFKEGARAQIGKFAPDWIEEAVEWIENMNGLGFNIYAVRNPIRADYSGSAKDDDIIASFFCWADCDDPAAAGNVYRFTGPKWSSAVTTGTVPSIRVHTYWQLKEPCLEMVAWRQMQTDIADHFLSDKSVVNPSRVMRVGGTVAYPNSKKQKRGYIKEITTLRTEYDETRDPVTMDQLSRVFETSPSPNDSKGGFQVDVGPQPLDRDRATIQALSGNDWHNAVIRLVGSYVSKGLSDGEIHALTDPLTLSGYTVEQTQKEVQKSIDGARVKGWTPEEYAEPEQINFEKPEEIVEPETVEWFGDIEPVLSNRYIVKGLLDHGTMSVVYGPSNSGKTFWALDLAFHIASDTQWRNRRVVQSAVLYLAAEGGRGVINRIAALKLDTGADNIPLALKRAGMDLLHDRADLQRIYDLSQTVQARAPGKPLVIVIDTLSRIMSGGDENSAADMTALIRNLDAIREATGAHIMLVHHTGKDSARGARGHSSLRAATDTEIEVQNEDGNRAAIVSKQRDYQGGEIFAFSLKSIELGIDQDGDEVSSCVVVEADESEFKQRKRKLTKNQKVLAETFDQLAAEIGKPNPGGPMMPEPGRFMTIQMDEFRAACEGKFTAKNTREAFLTAFDALNIPNGIFCMASGFVWRTDRSITR